MVPATSASQAESRFARQGSMWLPALARTFGPACTMINSALGHAQWQQPFDSMQMSNATWHPGSGPCGLYTHGGITSRAR